MKHVTEEHIPSDSMSGAVMDKNEALLTKKRVLEERRKDSHP